MTTASSDYDAAVKALRTQTLPAIVAYTEQGSAHGIMRMDLQRERIVVDVKNKRVISRTPAPREGGLSGDSILTKRIFDPSCYAATSEKRMRWNGFDVVAIAVARTATCRDDDDFSTVYADASTLDLLGADASETDDGMTVDISVRYGRFGSYVLPASVSAHAHGHGWLFWARERGEVTYSAYSFVQTRRQSARP